MQQAQLEDGLKIAKKRLESEDCRKFLSGVWSSDPLAVLNEFEKNNQFRDGGHSNKYVAYADAVGTTGVITLYDSFFNPNVGGYRAAFSFKDSATAREFLILHELGHATGSYYHVPFVKRGSAASVDAQNI